MQKLQKLFEPVKIGLVELKNRLVMAPMLVGYGINDMVSDRLKNFFAERAKGGVGFIIVNTTGFDLGREGSSWLGIYDDDFIPGLRELVDIIHAHGAKAAMQLGQSIAKLAYHEGTPYLPIGPSNISLIPSVPPPRPLTVEEIHKIADVYGEASRRGREAGFDAVEVSAGQGYALHQFMCPVTNKRTDQYGGSLENRMRFYLEIIDNIKRKAGEDFTLISRIAGEDSIEGGNTLEDTKKIVVMLERAGIHAVDLTQGFSSDTTPWIQMSVPRGAFIYQAEEVKKAADIPVIGGGRVNDPLLAEQIIAEGKADLVYMGRSLIADADLPNKAREGRFGDIRMCIACCLCFDLVTGGKPMVCSVNARVGREAEYRIEAAKEPKKVLVVGGGPGGMEAARVAAMRGHQVTLCERKDRLGGNLITAATPPYKSEISSLTEYLTKQVEKLGIRIKLSEEVTAKSIEEDKPDVVIVATGATPIILDIPGVKGSNVFTALEVLANSNLVAERVIIIGGGLIGCETAEFLAKKGKKVTILEVLESIGSDVLAVNRGCITERLRKAGIRMETRTKVEEITDRGVRVRHNGETEFFDGETIVLAVGMIPEKELAEELQGKVAELHVIGDCVAAGRIVDAIEGGFRTGQQI